MKLRNCRVCGKKGIKFASDGCKFCGSRWISDTEWKIAKDKGLTSGNVLRKPGNFEKIYRSFIDNLGSPRELMGFLFGASLLVIIGYVIFSPGPDPYFHGCVYEKTYGSKITCVEFKYNEAKNPGSYEEAFDKCMSSLRRIGESTVKDYEIHGCIDSQGPYN